MKRICLYGASENLGGTEVYLITMVRAVKNDFIFDFLVHHEYGKIPFEDEIISYGGKVYREYYKNGEKNLPEYISPEKLLSMHPEWDGIYLNLQSIDTSYRLLVAAKKRGLKYRIIHSHNANYVDQTGMKGKIYEKYFSLTKNYVVTDFLACSNMAGKWLFGTKTNCTVIPNSVDFDKFKINDIVRKEKRNEYEIADKEIVIGFCGRLTYQKNPEFLVDILSVLNEKKAVKLLIVGDGELKPAIVGKAKKAGVLESVIFAGSVNNTADYYQMMDCFVLPSRFEGFGIVLLEAQAAGLYCFTTDQAVPYETNVTGRVNFISQNATAEKWADSILKQGFERIDCQTILENSNYSINEMKRKILKLFKYER